jgi:hypothetical protein
MPIDIRRTELLQKEIPALKDRLVEGEEKRPVLATQADTVGSVRFNTPSQLDADVFGMPGSSRRSWTTSSNSSKNS